MVWNDLGKVTGEPGDITLDPSVAYGEAALTFQDVSFSVNVKDEKSRKIAEKIILAPVSGHFEPGSLIALMGPSGCGKTTLLDILAGKKNSPYKGTVHLNGRPRDKLFNRVTTYIPQDDIMPPHLTVQEVVSFYQSLKVEFPKSISQANLRCFIEERLQFMGLYDVRDVKIGSETVRGISGGQRRRVSLVCGLSTMAQLFFADEPTSGLSSTDAEGCVRYMRLLAKKLGLTLVVAIHQPRPEVSLLFDHLLLLTSNPGVVVYNGPMRDAAAVWQLAGYPVPEFANPTDYFLDLVSPGTRTGHPEHFIQFYRDNLQDKVHDLVQVELCKERKTALALLETRNSVMEAFGRMPHVRNTVYGVRFSCQLKRVFARQLRLSLRDPLGIGMELAVSIGQSVVIGVAYMDICSKEVTHVMLFFFMLIMTTALVGMKVMPKLIDERLVVKKETSQALYSDWAYIISFSVINWTSGIVGHTIFLALVFWMSSCPWELFPTVFLWTTMLYLTMDNCYTMIAAIAKDSTSALTLALPFIALFLLYNNFTVTKEILPDFMQFLLRLSPVAYNIQAVTIAASQMDPDKFHAAVEHFGYEDEFWPAVGFMCGCSVTFRVVQVICLKRLNNIQR